MRLEQLLRLEQLERLQRLQQLEKLQQLGQLEFYSDSYQNIDIKPNSIIYCDPPYVDEGGGYKHSFTEQDHRDLAELLLGSPHEWVLSYDDDENGLVRELYEGQPGIEITPVRWEYSSTKGNATNGKYELLITNNSVDANEV